MIDDPFSLLDLATKVRHPVVPAYHFPEFSPEIRRILEEEPDSRDEDVQLDDVLGVEVEHLEELVVEVLVANVSGDFVEESDFFRRGRGAVRQGRRRGVFVGRDRDGGRRWVGSVRILRGHLARG
jgi:hypothetical protein